MLKFVLLCLLSRLGYSLNDILTGRLARRFDRFEIAALRGVSLAVSMAPLLFWVPGGAWSALSHRGPELLLTCALTAASNVMQLEAARFLPFGLRAALIVGGVTGGSLALGWASGERLSATDTLLGLAVVGSAVLASRGPHSSHEIQPDIGRGGLLSVGSALLAAVVSWLVQRLARDSHAFLVAWAWEAGTGFALVLPVMFMLGRRGQRLTWQRFREVALASLPTVVGSGASVLALAYGELGLWGAFAGTQILFTVAFGVAWHRERLGVARAACFAAAAAAIALLAVRRLS